VLKVSGGCANDQGEDQEKQSVQIAVVSAGGQYGGKTVDGFIGKVLPYSTKPMLANEFRREWRALGQREVWLRR